MFDKLSIKNKYAYNIIPKSQCVSLIFLQIDIIYFKTNINQCMVQSYY